jgi:hypothetical protein
MRQRGGRRTIHVLLEVLAKSEVSKHSERVQASSHLAATAGPVPGRTSDCVPYPAGQVVHCSASHPPRGVLDGLSAGVGPHLPGPTQRPAPGAPGPTGAGAPAASVDGRVGCGGDRSRADGSPLAMGPGVPRVCRAPLEQSHRGALSRRLAPARSGPAAGGTHDRVGNPAAGFCAAGAAGRAGFASCVGRRPGGGDVEALGTRAAAGLARGGAPPGAGGGSRGP